jgi:hypothetical protein
MRKMSMKVAVVAGVASAAAATAFLVSSPADAGLLDPTADVTVSGTAFCPVGMWPHSVTMSLPDGQTGSSDFVLRNYSITFSNIPWKPEKGTAQVTCNGYAGLITYTDSDVWVGQPLLGNKTQRDLSPS